MSTVEGVRAWQFQPALPMRGVTRRTWLYPFHSMISTRTPHAGSDLETVELFWFASISTRTPHAGSDHALNKIIAVHADFNPHSPCGE